MRKRGTGRRGRARSCQAKKSSLWKMSLNEFLGGVDSEGAELFLLDWRHSAKSGPDEAARNAYSCAILDVMNVMVKEIGPEATRAVIRAMMGEYRDQWLELGVEPVVRRKMGSSRGLRKLR